MPAKKAPSANDTSNNLAAPKATPTATATTVSVNSSCDPVRATHHRSLGNSRLPTISISAMKALTLASVRPMVCHSSPRGTSAAELAPASSSRPDSAGSSTSTSTMTRSSTTSQPTAIWPLTDFSNPFDSRALSSTTVLATDRHKPNTSAAPKPQPQNIAAAIPSRVATRICTMAPGTAMRRTAIRSSNEKCKPTPNISSITPISAS